MIALIKSGILLLYKPPYQNYYKLNKEENLDLTLLFCLKHPAFREW